jgi:hypothetical protein
MSSKAFNRLSIAVFILVVLSVADACIGVFGSPYVFRVALGQTVLVSGDISDAPVILDRWRKEPDVETVNRLLGYTSTSQYLRLKFLEVRGRMWRGELEADIAAPVGQYSLQVFNAASKTPQEEPEYTIRVFPDQAALQGDLSSYTERWFGFKPIWIFFITLPVALLLLFLSHRRSTVEEARLQARGIGNLYKLARRKDDWEVLIGLGSAHGVRPGDHLRVLDRKMNDVGEIVIDTVEREGSSATLPLDADIKAGYFVALASMKNH